MSRTHYENTDQPDPPGDNDQQIDQNISISQSSPPEPSASTFSEEENNFANTSPSSSANIDDTSLEKIVPLLTANSNIVDKDYVPFIEGGRRTSRGELFRRPPFLPVAEHSSPPWNTQFPIEELNELARRLTNETTNDNLRARCQNCNSVAVTNYRWNTGNQTFGEIGVTLCEICGAWNVV